MRRDLTHYFEKSVPEVFEAYRAAAFQKFGKNSKAEPFHTISFGLNFSMKYNMNGGTCTVHLIPYGTGTAVDVRYTIVQAMGARYGAYDNELTNYVVGLLGVPAAELKIDIEPFLQPRNQLTPGAAPMPTAPQSAPAACAPAPARSAPNAPAVRTAAPNLWPGPAAPAPAPAAAPVPPRRFCPGCGHQANAGDLFCTQCGTRLPSGMPER